VGRWEGSGRDGHGAGGRGQAGQSSGAVDARAHTAAQKHKDLHANIHDRIPLPLHPDENYIAAFVAVVEKTTERSGGLHILDTRPLVAFCINERHLSGLWA
jgi:hypothetical protein